jgi:hypothetical protein
MKNSAIHLQSFYLGKRSGKTMIPSFGRSLLWYTNLLTYHGRMKRLRGIDVSVLKLQKVKEPIKIVDR